MVDSYSILKNTSYLFCGNLFQRFVSFFTAILITRYLGPERYGQFTFAFSVVGIAAVFWDFGLNTLITRNVSRDHSSTRQFLGSAIEIKAFLAILIIPSMLFTLKILDFSMNIIVPVAFLSIGYFVSSITGIFYSVFFAYRRMDYSALLNVLRSVLLLIAIAYVVIYKSAGLLEIVFCYCFSFCFVLFVSLFILITKFVLPVFIVNRAFLTSFCKESLPLLLIAAVNIMLFKIDHLMLSAISGDKELGLYGSSYTIFEVMIMLFPMIVMNATFPVLSNKFKQNTAVFEKLVNILFKYFVLFGIPMSLGFIFLGDEIVQCLYGDSYTAAGILLSTLGSGIWLFFLTSLLSWTLTSMDRQNVVLISNIVVLISNILLNIFFISKYGALGAAITTIMSETIQFGIMFSIFYKLFRFEVLCYLKILIASSTMAIFLVITKFSIFSSIPSVNLLVVIILAVAIYLVMIFFLKIFDRKEISLLLEN